MAATVLSVGSLIVLIGSILFLIAAFRESILWGLACLFISPVSLFFLIVHWSKAKNAFFIQLAGLGLMVLGYYLGGGHYYRHHFHF
jgi:hypothetical protein